MAKITFIIGGIRSGKSSYAVRLAKSLKKRVVFIATCVHPDGEMKKRIKQHRFSRPENWKVIEVGADISSALINLEDKYDLVLIDCLGLWTSNLLVNKLGNKEIEKRIKKFINTISKVKLNVILVSNEVGSSVVSDNPLARRFQDLVGFANQRVAEKADEVIFMQSGIPQVIKEGVKDAKAK